MSLSAKIDKSFYGAYQDNWDDILFREKILAHMRPEYWLLDLGAGAGIVAQMNFRGTCARVCGVDLDSRVVENGMLDEGKVADAAHIPYEDNTFDIVFADNVAEHLPDPGRVFEEACRVLKPGGRFLLKTPQRFHYVPLIASITPHRFHQLVNRLRGRKHEDTFPTLYRANSKSRIVRLAADSGLLVREIEQIEGRPEYLRMSALTYAAGLVYERIVNASSLFAALRVLLIVELQKPPANPMQKEVRRSVE